MSPDHTGASPAASGRERLAALDLLKAAAIVTVIGIHAAPDFWVHMSWVEAWTYRLFRFAVPAFLAVSGFLYYSPAPISAATVRRRLRRVLLPYVVVSGPALLYSAFIPLHSSDRSVLGKLFLGATFGPYYYVFLLTQFVLAIWVLSRLPRPIVTLAFVWAGVTTVLVELGILRLSLFWLMRSPHVWAGWFLLGWLVAAHRHSVLAFVERYSVLLIAGWLGAVLVWTALLAIDALPGRTGRGAIVVVMITNVVGLFALGQRLGDVGRPLRILSEWSYPLYLLHPFFVYAFHDIVEPALQLPTALAFPLRWAVGFVGALALTAVLRVVLGPWSRDVIGA